MSKYCVKIAMMATMNRNLKFLADFRHISSDPFHYLQMPFENEDENDEAILRVLGLVAVADISATMRFGISASGATAVRRGAAIAHPTTPFDAEAIVGGGMVLTAMRNHFFCAYFVHHLRCTKLLQLGLVVNVI